MKGFKAYLFLALSVYLCILTACAGHAPPNGPGPLFVANHSVPDGVVLSAYNTTLNTAGGLGPFTWTLSGGTLPPGLTLSSGGVISGTPPMSDLDSMGNAKSYNFTVKVTDSQTPTAAYDTANFSIKINPLLMVTSASLPNATIGLQYLGTLTNSGGLAPFTWTLTTGTLPAGLTLQASGGTITGTPTGSAACGTFPITVQVTDADSNTATANLIIMVVGKLSGNNAFSFNGFDNGQPFYTTGSFIGDCAGNITSGELDQNGLATQDVMTKVSLTGTYNIGTNGLGTMTLIFGGTTYNYQIAPPLAGDVKFILADSSHPDIYGSGVIKAQSLTTLGQTQQTGLMALKGSYGIGFFGVDPAGNRSAGAGAFQADDSGNLTSGVEDTNDNGTVQSQVAFMGTWALDSDFTNTGRGTITLNVGGNALHYAFYVVNPKGELVAVQTDPVSGGASLSLASLLSPSASITGGGFSIGSLNGSAVMELTGYTGGSSPLPDVQLGVGTFDGTGNITLFQTDENKAGTHAVNNYTGTYNISPNGRVTVAGLGTGPQPVWYLVGANRGFVIGTDTAVTQGAFEPQTGGTNSTPAGFSLPQFLVSYAGGTVQPVLASVTNEIDTTLITPPGGIIMITYDTSGSSGPQMNQMLSLMYALDPNNGATTGRFILTPLAPSLGPMEIVYLINAAPTGVGMGPLDYSNNKWATINITTATGAPDPNPRLTIVQSTAAH